VFRFLMDVVFKSLHSVLCDDAATTATFTLSLHDALPIWVCLGHLHETFVVNHNALNTDFHLTRKNKTWGWWRITDGTTLMQDIRSEEHTSELQSRENLVCRLLLEKKKKNRRTKIQDIPPH